MPLFPRTAVHMHYPTISCLCPTYGRPKTLANAIACFQAQDYPPDRCKLIVLDDLGNIEPVTTRNNTGTTGRQTDIYIQSTNQRYSCLPEKYNALVSIAPLSDIYVVWEDDDIQLPWCLKAHAAACKTAGWSYPSHVFSDYSDSGQPSIHIEETGNRFHGCLGIRRETLRAVGGWPLTRRADFDQQLISSLKRLGDAGNPIQALEKPPAYIFRWCNGTTHAQNEMRSPDDTDWYDRYQPPDRSGPQRITPAMDAFTQQAYGSSLDGHNWFPRACTL